MQTLSLLRIGIILCFLFFTLFKFSYSQETDSIYKPKPFAIHGDINLNLIGYGVSGIANRADPFTAVLSANVTASFWGIDLPFSIAISDKQKSYAQPFNEFGISPRWKWITLHGGYRNVTFSNFTLAGHTFFGAGIELNPGKFRFGFIYGRFDRKTSENPVYQTDNLPRFARRGYAFKIGVGTERTFFDLIVLRIRDDSTTMKQPDTGAIRTPEQNTALGMNSRFTFFKKLVWELEGGISLYTNNLAGTPVSDIENNSTYRSLNRFFSVNQSSEYYTAIRSSLQYKANAWSLKLEYRRIDPNYRSMGAYFFNNDLENITISPALGLFKRKLILNGSLGFQRDNLRITKQATSYRTIGNANISFIPSSKFGINAFYSNYSITQAPGRRPLNDTTRVAQATHNVSVTPRLMFFSSRQSHMVMLVYNLAFFTDKNRWTSGFTEFTSQTAMLMYNLGLMQSRWSFNIGLNYLRTDNNINNNSGIGGMLGISKTLAQDKLLLGWNNGLTRNTGSMADGWVFNSNLTAAYLPHLHHSLRLNIYFTGNYPDTGAVNPLFNEYKGDLSYAYTF